MRIIKYVLQILSVISCIIMIITIVLYIFHIRPFIVESGSMEPLYKSGSVVFVDTGADMSDIDIGDVVVYRNDASVIMHRLVDTDTTKGDANTTTEHIHLSDVNLVGKATDFIIPELGTVIEKLKKS